MMIVGMRCFCFIHASAISIRSSVVSERGPSPVVPLTGIHASIYVLFAGQYLYAFLSYHSWTFTLTKYSPNAIFGKERSILGDDGCIQLPKMEANLSLNVDQENSVLPYLPVIPQWCESCRHQTGEFQIGL